MEIKELTIAGRIFIDFGGLVVPLDRIVGFDFTVANGGASDNSVEVLLNPPSEDGMIFAYENKDAVRAWLDSHGPAVESEGEIPDWP